MVIVVIIIQELEYTEQVMHNALAHRLLSDAQPAPEQRPLASFPPVSILGMTPCGMEYAFGQLGSAVPAVSPLLSCLCPRQPPLAGHEKLQSP